MVALAMISLLDQLFLMLELHHIYLAKLLSPLSRSQYTVSSTKEFINMIKNETVPNAYKMLSFDVSSLFTMLSLDYAIDLIETNLWQ